MRCCSEALLVCNTEPNSVQGTCILTTGNLLKTYNGEMIFVIYNTLDNRAIWLFAYRDLPVADTRIGASSHMDDDIYFDLMW